MTARNCAEQGHIWREGIADTADWNDAGEYIGPAPLYVRHRDRAPGTVPVFCQYCRITNEAPTHARNTAPPQVTQ
jgi:hypothetical protein